MGPVVKQLEQTYAGRIEVRQYMVDKMNAQTPTFKEASELATKIGFNVTPTFLVVSAEGRVHSRYEGVVSFLTLKRDLDEVLAKK